MLQKYISLSLETLSNALSLIEEIFPYRKDQRQARKNLIDSLSEANANEKYWVATDHDEKVIGIIGLYRGSDNKKEKTAVWLGWFGVHPEYRGQGIGSSLLDFAVREARSQGYKTIRVETSLDKNEEAAHELYEKFGFIREKEGRVTETIFYTKDLAQRATTQGLEIAASNTPSPQSSPAVGRGGGWRFPCPSREGAGEKSPHGKNILKAERDQYNGPITINEKKERIDLLEIAIEWEGPFDVEEVIEKMDDEGNPPDYDGDDYGLYQIYGKHILCGSDTLLYVGKATQQTFSRRFKDHKKWWLADEEEIEVYVGRVYDPERHSGKDNWESWEADITLAESILIYKYSPNYNNTGIGNKPSLSPFEKVKLIHIGERHRLEREDTAPDDYS